MSSIYDLLGWKEETLSASYHQEEGEGITLNELVDLAFRSLELGAVNVYILRLVLQELVKITGNGKEIKVKLNEEQMSHIQSFKNYIAGAGARTQSGVGGSQISQQSTNLIPGQTSWTGRNSQAQAYQFVPAQPFPTWPQIPQGQTDQPLLPLFGSQQIPIQPQQIGYPPPWLFQQGGMGVIDQTKRGSFQPAPPQLQLCQPVPFQSAAPKAKPRRFSPKSYGSVDFSQCRRYSAEERKPFEGFCYRAPPKPRKADKPQPQHPVQPQPPEPQPQPRQSLQSQPSKQSLPQNKPSIQSLPPSERQESVPLPQKPSVQSIPEPERQPSTVHSLPPEPQPSVQSLPPPERQESVQSVPPPKSRSSVQSLPPQPSVKSLPPQPSVKSLPPQPSVQSLPPQPSVHSLPPQPSVQSLPPEPKPSVQSLPPEPKPSVQSLPPEPKPSVQSLPPPEPKPEPSVQPAEPERQHSTQPQDECIQQVQPSFDLTCCYPVNNSCNDKYMQTGITCLEDKVARLERQFKAFCGLPANARGYRDTAQQSRFKSSNCKPTPIVPPSCRKPPVNSRRSCPPQNGTVECCECARYFPKDRMGHGLKGTEGEAYLTAGCSNKPAPTCTTNTNTGTSVRRRKCDSRKKHEDCICTLRADKGCQCHAPCVNPTQLPQVCDMNSDYAQNPQSFRKKSRSYLATQIHLPNCQTFKSNRRPC